MLPQSIRRKLSGLRVGLETRAPTLLFLFDMLGDGVVVLDRRLFMLDAMLLFAVLVHAVMQGVDVAVNGVEGSDVRLVLGSVTGH